MAVDAGGEVWIGGQYEGDVFDNVPVLAKLHEDRGLVSVELEDRAAGALGKYAGSVAIGNDGVTLAVASPKSGVVITLDTLTGKALEIDLKPGTCGLQARRDGFVSSSEAGRFGDATHDLAWDNHIIGL
jgi:hypothetical protein